jgi:hypothetical protein
MGPWLAAMTRVAVGPRGIPVSADQKRQGEVFEDVIVGGLKVVIG